MTMLRRAAITSIAAAGIALGGCPPDVDEPERPPGQPCEEASDCTPAGAECGLVYACVDGVCEEDSSRTVPCDGGV